TQIVAVPAARYEGNEDGRGGFGALQYEAVMDQYRQLNTDPDHPMFVLLHHDGDNFGGGSEGYYGGNFNNMVNWAQANPNYDVSTIQDYLDRHPPAPTDLVHIEAGSWAGADNGDPEFKKWLGDPDPPLPGETVGWSPDRNSWAVLTAAKNYVNTAHDHQVGPDAFPDAGRVIDGVGNATERGWHYLLQAQASDHWYWDGTEVWDSNVTRGSNLAIAQVASTVAGIGAAETTAPSVFHPQREAYNPGGEEFGQAQPSDFEVWTYAYDVSGLASVTLKYRVDADGVNPLDSTQNETYAGGAEVGQWIEVDMTSSDPGYQGDGTGPPPGILTPTARALRFGGMIEGITDSLVDYYVEAVDTLGNVQRSDIQHVYVGDGAVAGADRVVLTAASPGMGDPGQEGPAAGDPLALTYDPTGSDLSGAGQVFAHIGFNDWTTVLSPDTALTWDASQELWTLTAEDGVVIPSDATSLELVFNNGGVTGGGVVWDNNGGADWRYAVTGGEPGGGGPGGRDFVMDGVLDADVTVAATDDGRTLWYAVDGETLYLATDDAGEGADVFLYVADETGDQVAANWAKTGTVAEWDALAADENDNDYEGWFDSDGQPFSGAGSEIATGPNGGVLEATIDLGDLLGSMPEDVYVAVAHFATGDGGTLEWVLGELSANGSVDAAEFVRLPLADPTLAGDYNGDGVVDAADYTVWRDSYDSTENLAADGDGDGRIDDGDYAVWLATFGNASAQGSTVPEPTAALTAAVAVTFAGVRRRS
ncbi:MAG: hypothetical protein AAF805_09465, partial [Planctomycetota bacterium]